MKRLPAVAIGSLLFIWCVAYSATAGPVLKEKYLVVKTTDRDNNEAYQVMTPNEFKALDAEIRNENKYTARARMAAEKIWRADEDTANKAFPNLPARTARVMKEFDDQTKADNKVADYLSKQSEAEKKAEEKNNARQQKNGFEKAAKAASAANARKSLMSHAISVFETHLREAMAPTAEAKPDQPEPKPDQQPDHEAGR